MNTTFAKSLIAAAILALTASAAHAVIAGTPVTIQESAIPLAGGHVFQADQLSGQYDEVITTTAATASSGSFVTEAIFGAGQWFNAGSALSTQLNAFGDSGYGIYAKFSATGNYTVNALGVISFLPTGGVIQVFADANHDTKYDVKSTATGNVNNLTLSSGAGSVVDDFLLGSANVLLTGSGNANSGGLGTANGNFELLFASFDLTDPRGLAYFIAPRPFNLQLDLNGNFQNFIPLGGVGTSSSTQLLNNSANAFFLNSVPEPSALALAGIALVGAAVATRRKTRKG